MSLVEITAEEYDILIDIAYATERNFTGQPVYSAAKCYLHEEAAEKLRVAVQQAALLSYRVKVFDAFRPAEAQWKLWNHTPDPNFLADPAKGSPHSRGVAVDLTLCDEAGNELDMGTAFDTFSPLSHHGITSISVQAQRNRLILLGIMTSAGWDFYRNEWWHYQLFNSRNYQIYNDKDSGTGMMEQ